MIDGEEFGWRDEPLLLARVGSWFGYVDHGNILLG